MHHSRNEQESVQIIQYIARKKKQLLANARLITTNNCKLTIVNQLTLPLSNRTGSPSDAIWILSKIRGQVYEQYLTIDRKLNLIVLAYVACA